ncbi:MAG: HAMP domain-containing histidine kinase [Spartobacteria bacterium]|nr:HAMP domain-containing histidine kinase [Spartobacteria bacterium]
MDHKKTLFWQIVTPYLLIIVLSISALVLLSSQSIRNFNITRVEKNLLNSSQLIQPLVEHLLAAQSIESLQSYCRAASSSDMRITVIMADGRVVADTDSNPSLMENHAMRPEIVAARSGLTGVEQRFSDTLKVSMLYVARPILLNEDSAGAVLRVCKPLTMIDASIHAFQKQIIWGGMVTFVLAALTGLLVARRISEPLRKMCEVANSCAQGDFSLRTPPIGHGSQEVSDLANAINCMASKLEDRISVIKENHENLQSILASMKEGVMAFDKQGELLMLNDAARNLLNLKAAVKVGVSHDVCTNDEALSSVLREAIYSDEPLARSVDLFDGAVKRFIRIHTAKLKAKNGTLVVLHDMTQINQVEAMRRDFVANVSHELKTPITSIKGFVETLIDNPPAKNKDQNHFLRIISRQADRLQAIVDDLLTLARIEADADYAKPPLQSCTFDDLLNAAKTTCMAKAKKKNVVITLESPPRLKSCFNILMMEQALVNLLDNSIKYSPEGTEVTCGVQESSEHYMIYVRDRGCGIAPEHMNRIFERFYRVDKARSRSLGGTGLGLSIVKHIVLAHTGTITVDSRLGEGTTFRILLPKVIDESLLSG